MDATIKIPKDLSEITLGQYQDFLNVQAKNTDEEFISQKMISIFCDISMLEVLKIRLTSLNEIIEHFSTIFSVKHNLSTKFTLNGVEYGFVPKLESLTFGEYIDLETSLSEWSDYHTAMSVLYRPVKDSYKNMYSIEDYEPSEPKQMAMKSMPLSVVLGATVFFYHLEKELLSHTLASSEVLIKTMNLKTSQAEEHSLKIGGGIQAYTQSLRETLQSLEQSRNSMFLSVLPFSPLKNRKKK